MNRDEILAEIDDQIEALRRYTYDERRERTNWRDRQDAKAYCQKIDDMICLLEEGK